MVEEVRAFVLTDLVGSTELWDVDPVNMAVALETHDALVAGVVEGSGGELIGSKGEGDSTFSVFVRPGAAVEAARRIVAAMAATDWPTIRPLVVRVGIHVGPAQCRGVDWFGSTVNRTARIRALAVAGGVLVSGATADTVRDGLAPDAALRFLGRRRLRGLREREDVWAVVSEGETSPVLTSDGADSNVEEPHHAVWGRDEDIARVEVLLEAHRLVTVTGAGGTGKTRLAVEVALRSRDAYPDGVWLVDLATVTSGAVLAFVLSRVGAPAATGVEALVERECLIVLDNCEHVLGEAAHAAVLLLRSAPRIRILATSRHPLGLAAEAAFPLQPLPVPVRGASLAVLRRHAAFGLFVERAEQVDPSFAVSPTNADAMTRCLIMVDGVPLAIELAASLTRSMSLQRVAELLERDLPALRSSRRDATDRHRSVGATVEWSLALLDPIDRDALETLSVCRGFSAETVAALVDVAETAQILGRLVDASLVVALGGDRFRLLEPIRQHAAHRLAAENRTNGCMERLAAHVADSVRALGGRIYTDPSVRISLRHEAGNIEQSLTWLLEQGRDGQAIRLVGGLGHFWFTDDQATGQRWLARVEPLLDRCDETVAAPVRVALGMHRQGSAEACAIPQLTRALASYEEHGRILGAATAAFWLARELAIDGLRPESETRPAVERALGLAQRADQPILISWSLIWLASLARRAGDNGAAEQHLRKALEVSLAVGVVHPIGSALAGLADLAVDQGDVRLARQLADRAVAANRRTGDGWQLAGTLGRRALLGLADRDLTRAALDISETAELALDVGDEHQIAESLAGAALILNALDYRDAARSAVSSLEQWMLSHATNQDSVIRTAVNRLGPSSPLPVPDPSALPIRAELRTVIQHLNTTGTEPIRSSRRAKADPP